MNNYATEVVVGSGMTDAASCDGICSEGESTGCNVDHDSVAAKADCMGSILTMTGDLDSAKAGD